MIGKEIDLKINFDMLPTSNKTIDAKALVLRENEKYRMMYIPKIVEIITYDELFSKMKILYKALGGKDD